MAMMYDGVNEVRLLGRILFEPKLKDAYGHKYLRTVLVVKENQTAHGKHRRITTYHPLTMLDDVAQLMNGKLTRGIFVYVYGRLNHYYQSDAVRMSDVVASKISIIAKKSPEEAEEDLRYSDKEIDEEFIEQYDNVVPISKFRLKVNEDPEMPF